MKRIALCFTVLAALAAGTSSAQASDLTEIVRILFNANHRPNPYAAQQAHYQHHVDLENRAIEREFVHQAAHQQPLTDWQHGRLHSALEREDYRDAVEHDVAHATRAYARPVYSPRTFAPGVYPPQVYPPQVYQPQVYQPQYSQGYRGVPVGYGAPYGAPQYQAYRFDSRVGCSPYGGY